ncbi:exo-beta-1,3-glucanase [Rhodocollybia butyracea]|uniref:Exo-beta-1,3-glucanase n=1 Tax=Rhodocollybia butyracea TaxID=206335 RepID=A0A9P5U7C2_9AGAR|nr:exo-beta-1,3-glucanase [Rhodocollybia butyracea]
MQQNSFRLSVAIFGLLVAFFSSLTPVTSLGTSCSAPITSGTAAAGAAYWMENIKHQGTSAFNPNPSSYQVFRNVKDFGAKGDGVTDDTAAINSAISSGNRCGQGTCPSSTITPAVVFFPSGTYLVSSPIIAYYYTQLIGDARNPPRLLASASFAGMAVIDADPYLPNGGGMCAMVHKSRQFVSHKFKFLATITHIFPTFSSYRSIRNFIIDVTRVPATNDEGTGIHWQAAQATSLINIVFEMSTAANTAHQGIFMENGSGGFMGDLGGKFGMWVGNQQFTVRNVTVNNAQTAVFGVGFDLTTGGVTQADQTVGAEAIIDAIVSNTPIFVRSSVASNGKLAGSLVINNAQLTNVPTAVGIVGGATVLAGGTTTITSWGQGNVYTGTNTAGKFTQGSIVSATKPSSLLDSTGRIVGRGHPQYADYAVSQIVSVKSNGAKGTVQRTTQLLCKLFSIKKLTEIQFSGCAIIFFDAGTYIVTSTLKIPAGTQMVGEAWSVIAGKGSAFQNQASPQVVVQVGAAGSSGIMEISDIVFTTVGPTPGAIVVEWNVAEPSGTSAGAGMWDSHFRLGGGAGTNLETSQCPSSGSGGTTACFAAFLALHLTASSTAYLEGTWVWLADHDLDGNGVSQLAVFSGRGILSQSAGPVWMIGTACKIHFCESEHHTLYQYSLVNAKNHYMGLIQTETPYYQPAPAAPSPFSVNSAFQDPTVFAGSSAWALHVTTSTDIIVFGAGLYSFFQSFSQNCLNNVPVNCQSQIVNIDSTSSVNVYSLSTLGSTFQLSVNNNGIANEAANANGFAETALPAPMIFDDVLTLTVLVACPTSLQRLSGSETGATVSTP